MAHIEQTLEQVRGQINVDVAVVGGGLAGGVTACLLAGVGLRVAAIDRAAPTARLDSGFDGRTTAISYGSRHIFRAAGLWEALEPDASPIHEIRIADGAAPLYLHFDTVEVATRGEGRPFGWIVENRLIRAAIERRLAALAQDGAAWIGAPLTVASYAAEGGRARLSTDAEAQIAASLVIGADGRSSTMRDLAGIGTSGRDYRQTALVFIAAHEHPHAGVAVEHFRPRRPLRHPADDRRRTGRPPQQRGMDPGTGGGRPAGRSRHGGVRSRVAGPFRALLTERCIWPAPASATRSAC